MYMIVYNPLNNVRKNALTCVIIRSNQLSGCMIDQNEKIIVVTAKMFFAIESTELILNANFINRSFSLI